MRKTTTFVIILFAASVIDVRGQQFSNPVEYLNHLGQLNGAIQKDLWSYLKAAAHSGNARKIEKKRMALIDAYYSAYRSLHGFPAYQGDASLRNAVAAYYKLTHTVLKEDFGKIVDMEAIAEQSYDLMEAYIMAKEAAHKKLDDAFDELMAQQDAFAAKHNITLTDERSKKGQKIDKASDVFAYYNKMYLVFFKSYKQDLYLWDAVTKNDLLAIEQNKNALKNFAEEASATLDTFPRFKNDVSLKLAARNVMTFYRWQVDEKIADITAFHLAKEHFEKTHSSFEAKRKSERTQKDVDEYNKAVNDYNEAVAKVNVVNEELNKRRSVALDEWNKTVDNFFSEHVP